MTDTNAQLMDSYGRRITTLRISLTDHCNFRCTYCMPPEGLSELEPAEFLTRAQIERFVRVVGDMGVSRVRLTGGEPLLRKNILDIVRSLKQIPTVHELSLTTNASLLERLAEPLREAGLDRINVSLDSLDAERFAEITRRDQYDRVRRGIAAAVKAGFPTKINVVVLQGMPDDEVLAFARMAFEKEIDVRFLEFMPLCGTGWDPKRLYPIADVRSLIREHYHLTELPRGDAAAQSFAFDKGAGRLGFIASLSEPFCDTCSRMRLSADGKIRPCLFSDFEVAVDDLLNDKVSDSRIRQRIEEAVWLKPRGSEFADKPFELGQDVELGPLIRSIGG